MPDLTPRFEEKFVKLIAIYRCVIANCRLAKGGLWDAHEAEWRKSPNWDAAPEVVRAAGNSRGIESTCRTPAKKIHLCRGVSCVHSRSLVPPQKLRRRLSLPAGE